MNIGFKIKENQDIDSSKIKVTINAPQSRRILVNYINDHVIVVVNVIIENTNNRDIECYAKSDNAVILKENEGSQSSNVIDNSQPCSISGQKIMPLMETKLFSKKSFGTNPIIISSQKSVVGDLVFRISKANKQLLFAIGINDDSKVVVLNKSIDYSLFNLEKR